MITNISNTVPEPHRQFLQRLIEILRTDTRIVGVAIGGSYLTNSIDAFSDLDLVIAIEPNEYSSVMTNRKSIAASLGTLLAAFTGEHVGEPRLLVCLYDKPLLHVDLKFVCLEDVAKRIEEPAILWEREGRFTKALEHGKPEFPAPNQQWIEERCWIWVHYVLTKIGRGELFEAIESLSFLRQNVLGPLALYRAGGCPSGVRKIETIAPEFAMELRRTVAAYDAADCLRALRASVELYRSLRPHAGSIEIELKAERAAMDYLSIIEQRCGLSSNSS
ncbi:MAG: aminoglycoside 6-adenylyltransferase [Bacteroidota bacterium]